MFNQEKILFQKMQWRRSWIFKMIDEKTKQILKKLENRTPKQEEKSRLDYCKDAIKDKNFKLVKWKLKDKSWTHDHCDLCGTYLR
jgi:hypothetical protein